MNTGADPNASNINGHYPLHIACEHGHKEIAEMLVLYKANVNATDRDLITPLHLATLRNHLEVVNFLLQNGADPNLKDNMGRSSWSLSTKYERVSVGAS